MPGGDILDDSIYMLWRALLYPKLSLRSRTALGVYESAEALYEERVSAAMLLGGQDPDKLLNYPLMHAAEIYAKCEAAGIQVLFPNDSGYPGKLDILAEKPQVLFVKGSLEGIGRSCAVIGARNADSYAVQLTRKLSRELARRGITVFSGFAVGIDRAAHLGALDASGRTVAVLGSGILFDYPRGSMTLKELIAERGAVISEYPPDEPPLPEHFLIRNRITAALSDCVLCTQAAARSGSLNTAGYALEQSKPVYVTPPHNILDGSCEGMISLLRDGAEQVYSAEDIIRGCYG